MKDLAQLIRDNPGAYFEVDNDCWTMFPGPPPDNDEEFDKWQSTPLADDGDVIAKGSGYGSGNCYGGDIL